MVKELVKKEKKNKKMGRPKKNKYPRTEKITIMLSENEKKDIQYCADKLNVSRTDVIVKSVNLLQKELNK